MAVVVNVVLGAEGGVEAVYTDYDELVTVIEDPHNSGAVWIFKGEQHIGEAE